MISTGAHGELEGYGNECEEANPRARESGRTFHGVGTDHKNDDHAQTRKHA